MKDTSIEAKRTTCTDEKLYAKKPFLTVLQVCVGIKMFCLSALPRVLQSASPKVSQ